MKYKRSSSVMVLVLALVLLTGPVQAMAPERTVELIVEYTAGADAAAVEAAMEALGNTEVTDRYSTLIRGAAVRSPESALDAIRMIPGVAHAAVAARFEREYISAPLQPSNTLPVSDGTQPDAAEHNGDGTVIAVIDSGLRLTHQVFADYGLAREPALTEEEVEAFLADESHSQGRYFSPRIPFVYDYFDNDEVVLTTDDHGTHVTALAAGYAQNQAGEVIFRGAAPAAQILAMKVFDDEGGYASETDIIRALEDAWTLGADVVNLSLGMDRGFYSDDGMGGSYIRCIRRLSEQGVLVFCAAGNGGDALYEKVEGVLYPTADYTDYGTITAPAVFPGAIPVAAAEATSYEIWGCVEVGGERISYIEASAEEPPLQPSLATLDGRALKCAAVPGLGTKEDFARVNVRGKVALVHRGTVTFAEKARNAAAAGAVACLFINNDSVPVTPSIDGGITVPCALVGQAEGQRLLTAAAAGETVVFRDEPCLVREDAPIMMSGSAWGPVGDLGFAPAITATGGNALSAVAAADNGYGYMSGTSMATPTLSGAAAVMLQQLRRRGDVSGEDALVRAVLESTAQLITDEYGTPVSPRQQGAGLVDLSAALSSDCYIPSPLLELGESGSGSFSFTFRVKNTGESEKTFALEPVVLTDDYFFEGEQAYSLLAPLDLGDAVDITLPDRITVPAGGETAVAVKLQVRGDALEQLREIYSNGFFLEGYILLTDGSGGQIHASYLGYCGDWEQAPVIEQADIFDLLQADGAQLPVNMGTNLVYLANRSYLTGGAVLGQNPWGGDGGYLADRNAIATEESDAMDTEGFLFTMDLYTLRNAAHVVMLVVDAATGRIYYADDTPWLHRAARDELLEQMRASGWFTWDGSDGQGGIVPDNTRVQVKFYAWTESDTAMQQAIAANGGDSSRPASYQWLAAGPYDRCLEFSFPVTVDRSAPTLALERGDGGVTLTVSDNRHAAYLAVQDEEGQLLVEEFFAGETAGECFAVELPVDGELPEKVYAVVGDYASNTVGLAVDLATGEITASHVALLEDVSPGAWYCDAVEYACGSGLAAWISADCFEPDRAATRLDAVQMLYAMSGETVTEWRELPFADVSASADYRPALQWAYDAKLAHGVAPDIFGGLMNLSRQQAAVFFYRRAFLAGEDTQSVDLAVLERYADGHEIALWARPAVAWAVERGVLSGREGGALAGRDSVTRAELAQMAMNYLENP